MYDREQLLSMIDLFYNELKQKNNYKVKPGSLKETFNLFLRVKSAIESSKLPEEEKNVYKSKIYKVLRCSDFNLVKTNEQIAKRAVKEICFCVEEIYVSLKKESKKPKSTSR
jgi:hypothetical protein